MDIASFTPGIAFTAHVCPMLIPGPKFVCVIPEGAMISSITRINESVPGSDVYKRQALEIVSQGGGTRNLRPAIEHVLQRI